MLTDDLSADLSASLRANAALVADPAHDLLARVEGLAARRHRRRVVSGIAAFAVLLAAVSTGLAVNVRHDSRPSTLSVATPPKVDPAVAIAGLTGSTCDPVGPRPPAHFLTWPCVGASPALSRFVTSTLAHQVLAGFGSIEHPRMRFIAGNYQRSLVEWWDPAHPETPTQLLAFEGGGFGNIEAPAGDPDVLGTIQRTAYARSGITTLVVEPTGERLQLIDGAHETPEQNGSYSLKSLVGYDADGRTQPSWTTAFAQAYPSDIDSACSGHATTGTCQYVQQKLADLAPAATCDSLTGKAPAGFLDWPCVAPADASAGQRVAAALAEVRGRGRHVGKLRARLLVDTRDAAGPTALAGPDISIVEVWDPTGTGPAVDVLVGYGLRPGYVAADYNPGFGHSDAPVVLSLGSTGGTTPDGKDDPNTMVQSFVARSDVTTIDAIVKGHTYRLHRDGGVFVLSYRSAASSGEITPSPALTAYDAAGHVVGKPGNTVIDDYSGNTGLCSVGNYGSTCGDVGSTHYYDAGTGSTTEPSAPSAATASPSIN